MNLNNYQAHANGPTASNNQFKAKFGEVSQQAKRFVSARENRTTVIGGIAFAAMFVLFVIQVQMHDSLKQRVSKLEGLLLMKAQNSIQMDVSQAAKKQERRASKGGSVAKKQRRAR